MPRKKLNIDYNFVLDLYLNKYFSIQKIADQFECSSRPIYDFLRKKGLLRTSGESQRLKNSKYGCKKLGRRKNINVSELVRRYENGESLKQLSKYFNYSDASLMYFLKEAGVVLRPAGFKKGSKYDVNLLVNLYQNGTSLREISKQTKCSYNTIRFHLLKNKIDIRTNLKGKSFAGKKHSEATKHKISDAHKKRFKKHPMVRGEQHHLHGKPQTNEHIKKRMEKRFGTSYEDYLKQLPKFTKYKNEVVRITYRQNIGQLSNFEKRGKAGVEGAYHLDHKFSILEGFKQGIDPNIIGGIKNLHFIPWQENISKGDKCSITIANII